MENTQNETMTITPFERFKGLTRKLVKIPKSELDVELEREGAEGQSGSCQ